jgi:hypothetical protein
MSSRNSIDMITDKNALSIGESIGWKKLVGQVELPKLIEWLKRERVNWRLHPLIHTQLVLNVAQNIL